MFIRYLLFFLIFIKTPLLASLVLILISILVRIYISIQSSKWMSFLVILLFLGGIIVLFVYICTLISRIKIIVIDSYKYFIFIVGLIGGFRLIFLNQKSYFVLDLKKASRILQS